MSKKQNAVRRKSDLTFEKAHEFLTYDKDTGFFYWKLSRMGAPKKGSLAGSITSEGYIAICVDSDRYQAHRLAWLMHYGDFPSTYLDHINRNKTDNRICNLREVSNGENCKNVGVRKSSSSGYTGVSWHKAANKWNARIMVNWKRINLGLFESKEDAYLEYVKASQKFFPSIKGGIIEDELPDAIRANKE